MKNTTNDHHVHVTLVKALSAASGLAEAEIGGQLSRPPKAEMGDYAFPCFAYAKTHKQPPPAAAAALAEKLKNDPQLGFIASVDAAGPFLNIRVKPGALSDSVIRMVRSAAGHYGESDEGCGKTIVIDYSSPNIAKPFHVGHLMTTVLGASLARINRKLGYTVVGVNHLGDWGVQCGFQFVSWNRADPQEREKQLEARGLDYLCELYVNINAPAKQAAVLFAELESNSGSLDAEQRAKLKAQADQYKAQADALDAEARAAFKKLEQGDPELKKLWERLRGASLSYLQKVYDRLGIQFESFNGEAFYEPMLLPLVNELQASGVAVESEGAIVIPMDDAPPKPGKDRKPPFIILTSNKTTIYGTRDLAAVLYRKKTYDFHKCLYVVDMRQSLQLGNLFKAVQKMGHAWSKDLAHVSLGLMQIADGDSILAMSTRGGSMIPLNQLLDTMVGKVLDIVREKNPELPADKANQVAEAVGVGAVVFWAQARRRISNSVFDWQKATDPSGDTGPYLQYTHARARSILRKAGIAAAELQNADLTLLCEPEEAGVAKALEAYPDVLRQAAQDNEPSLVSSYLLELASAFGKFLNRRRVIDSPDALKRARLALADAVGQTLADGLALLGVKAPEEM
jgi:arginyl-tRNA synthetase